MGSRVGDKIRSRLLDWSWSSDRNGCSCYFLLLVNVHLEYSIFLSILCLFSLLFHTHITYISNLFYCTKSLSIPCTPNVLKLGTKWHHPRTCIKRCNFLWIKPNSKSSCRCHYARWEKNSKGPWVMHAITRDLLRCLLERHDLSIKSSKNSHGLENVQPPLSSSNNACQ